MKLDKSKIEKILVINFGTAEEVLQSTSVAENLRHNFPGAVIIFLVQKQYADALNNNPFLTRILTFDFESDSRKCLRKNIRSQRYDLIIDLSGDSLSSSVVFSSKAKYKVGAAHGLRGFAYNIKIDNSSDGKHNTESYLNIIRTLGIEIISNVPKTYKINISDLERAV